MSIPPEITALIQRLNSEFDRMRITLTSDLVTNEQVQNAGEDLAELLGQALEAKVVVNSVKTRLEN